MERKDRSLRLWGERGQLALESSSVCLLNATATGTEVLKNIVLPGIKSFTIVDHNVVTEADLGNNFFVEPAELGKPRGEVVTRLLLELNNEVSGHFVTDSPESLVNSKPEFFSSFSVVVATGLAECTLRKLAGILWTAGIPLCVGRSYGLLGYWRNVFAELPIVESKPEFFNEDHRLTHPFPELLEFVGGIDLTSIVDTMEHSHVPYFVILVQAIVQWKQEHGDALPASPEDKNAFKQLIVQKAIIQSPLEENFAEAVEKARFCWATEYIPANVQRIFDSPLCCSLDHSSTAFWIIARALKDFVANEGGGHLPLSGQIPDMHADTERYLSLQKLFLAKAHAEWDVVVKRVNKLLSQLGRPADSIAPATVRFHCRYAGHLQVVQCRSIEEEYTECNGAEWGFFVEMPEEYPHIFYILLRAADSFHSAHGRYPSSTGEDGEADLGLYKEAVSATATAMGIASTSLKDDYVCEMCRWGAAELHNIAAIVGGLGAQEVIKIIMKQYTPLNNTFLWNGVSSASSTCQF